MFRTTDAKGVLTPDEGVKMIMPGDNTTINVELVAPHCNGKEIAFSD